MDANDKTKLGSGWRETIAYLILLTSSLKETVHQHNDDDLHGLAERNSSALFNLIEKENKHEPVFCAVTFTVYPVLGESHLT